LHTTEAPPVYLNPAYPGEQRLDDLLGRMTLDEKLAQLTSYWYYELQDGHDHPAGLKMRQLLRFGIGQISRVAGSSTLSPVQAARAGNAIQDFLVKNTRLGIPAILHEECCSGLVGLGGTAFPQMIGLASTWNPALAEQMTTEIRRQMLAVGARQGLGPVLDIGSDPRWGRIEETFGEDPLLASQFGVAYIRGLQGDDPGSGVMATGKHFVGHSLSNGGLNCAPATMGPRQLWETYLMPFQAAIQQAGVQAIMNAYPELDGEVVAASHAILTGLLRHKLGFAGLLVSDYLSIPMIHTYYRAAPDEKSAALMALRAGIELELPTRVCYGEPLRQAIEAGEISMPDIDAVTRHVLQVKLELGLFENPYANEGAVLEIFETETQRALARHIALQSMVLLKNDGLLPLSRRGTLAVIGPNAHDPRNLLGGYSYPAMLELLIYQHTLPSVAKADAAQMQTHAVRVPSVLDSLREHLGQDARVVYAAGCQVSGQDRSGLDEAVRIASQADAVILVLGDKAGLTPDCTTGETRDRTALGLPGIQEELARLVAAAGKPLVAVLVNGRPVSSPWLQEHANAILEAWLPGEEGGAAIAQALFGEANPGGKLPVTVARSVGQLPICYNHKPSGSTSNWYTDYVDLPVSPLYPFGHGLSYTSFAYSDLQIAPAQAQASEQVDISLRVSNTGERDGDEVVQLYICDEYASIPRPVKELKGFCRLHLKPGESRKVIFHLPVNMLAYYDEQLELVVEGGKINIMLGSSSADIRLQGEFEISALSKTVISQRLFACPVSIQ
jgi:beta-glucosidase